MAGAHPYSPERIAAVKVDPALLYLAVQDLAEQYRPRRRHPDMLALCASAYLEYMDMDAEPDEDVLGEGDLLVIAAMVSRLNALAALIEQGKLPDSVTKPDLDADPFSSPAVIEAACSATLILKADGASFQLLDFLAHLPKAGKPDASW